MGEQLRLIFSADPVAQHQGLVKLRTLVSLTTNTMYECGAVIRAAHLLPKIIAFLDDDAHPALQMEAAWLLTNLSAGSSEHTQAVVKNEAVPRLIRLLASPSPSVVEQCAWALGNISGDCPKVKEDWLRWEKSSACTFLHPSHPSTHLLNPKHSTATSSSPKASSFLSSPPGQRSRRPASFGRPCGF